MFDPYVDMGVIEGAIADLAAKTLRPRGYPFSKITITYVDSCKNIQYFFPSFAYKTTENVLDMKRLDFKKAGKDHPEKVKEWKSNLTQVPPEYIICKAQFEIINEPTRKTTSCRQYIIEVECEDREDWWQAICFKKAVKKFITEDLDIPILHPIFGDKYPELNVSPVPRVWCKVFNCSEFLYQALEKYGKQEFSDTPIRLCLVRREELYNNKLDKNKYNMYNLDGVEIGIQI